MPHINDMRQSNYMNKADVGSGKLVTISHLEQKNIAQEGEPKELKWIMYFDESDAKPFILNPVNQTLTAAATGSEISEEWTGKQIVLFIDPSVIMHGKVVGGIRVRAPRNKPAPAHAPKPAPAPAQNLRPSQMAEPPDEEDDSGDVPF